MANKTVCEELFKDETRRRIIEMATYTADRGIEVGAFLCQSPESEEISLGKECKGEACSVTTRDCLSYRRGEDDLLSSRRKMVGLLHTHPSSDFFSPEDIKATKQRDFKTLCITYPEQGRPNRRTAKYAPHVLHCANFEVKEWSDLYKLEDAVVKIRDREIAFTKKLFDEPIKQTYEPHDKAYDAYKDDLNKLLASAKKLSRDLEHDTCEIRFEA